MKKFTSHLWFDKEAKEAADFYVGAFGNGSKVTNVTQLHNTPSGDTDIVNFELLGHSFMAISAGPYFTPNASISFIINFDPSRDSNAKESLNTLWEKLSEGGKVLMTLDKYPFSEHYGWVQDKYGFSWQLILTNPSGEERPNIIPSLLFTNDVYGKAEEALNFYTEVFRDSKKGNIAQYPEDQAPHTKGTLMFGDFLLEGKNWFAAMDGPGDHQFQFNEAISFIVPCDSQEEIDYYWEKLSAVPESEQCGWLKDKFGVSWQIVPSVMDQMMTNGSEEQLKRVTEAFLQMKKFNIAELEEAYNEAV